MAGAGAGVGGFAKSASLVVVVVALTSLNVYYTFRDASIASRASSSSNGAVAAPDAVPTAGATPPPPAVDEFYSASKRGSKVASDDSDLGDFAAGTAADFGAIPSVRIAYCAS